MVRIKRPPSRQEGGRFDRNRIVHRDAADFAGRMSRVALARHCRGPAAVRQRPHQERCRREKLAVLACSLLLSDPEKTDHEHM